MCILATTSIEKSIREEQSIFSSEYFGVCICAGVYVYVCIPPALPVSGQAFSMSVLSEN